MLWAIALLVASTVAMAQSTCRIPDENAASHWCVQRNSDTAIIFVHGVLSDSRNAWLRKAGEANIFWPALISADEDFKDASIFLAGYYSGADAGEYGISDAARDLFEDISRNTKPSVMSKKNLLFVAHSLGGIVTRYMLERRREQFQDKTVGLVLIASPGRGSEWADRLEYLTSTFVNHKFLKELTSNNSILDDLDRRFSQLASERSIPKLSGRDYFEQKFILPNCWIINCQPVVRRDPSPSYFGDKILIPDSDHMTIVKPGGRAERIYVELKNYYLGDFANTVRSGQAPSVNSYGFQVIDGETSPFVMKSEPNWTDREIRAMIDKAPNVSFNKTIIRFQADPSADYSLVANELTLRGGAKIITNGTQVRFLVKKLTVLDGEILVTDRN